MTPTMILEAFCKRHRLAAPQYAGTTQVSVAGRTYNLQDYERNKPHNSHWGAENERLACYVLNGLPIVKEHVETRILRSKLQPAFDQVGLVFKFSFDNYFEAPNKTHRNCNSIMKIN